MLETAVLSRMQACHSEHIQIPGGVDTGQRGLSEDVRNGRCIVDRDRGFILALHHVQEREDAVAIV